jgi:hypothetical protein
MIMCLNIKNPAVTRIHMHPDPRLIDRFNCAGFLGDISYCEAIAIIAFFPPALLTGQTTDALSKVGGPRRP